MANAGMPSSIEERSGFKFGYMDNIGGWLEAVSPVDQDSGITDLLEIEGIGYGTLFGETDIRVIVSIVCLLRTFWFSNELEDQIRYHISF